MTDRALYPIQVVLRVGVTNGKGRGEAEYVMPSSVGHGFAPSDADIEEALSEISKALPESYRLMTREEHFLDRIWDHVPDEPRVAVPRIPSGHCWFDPETATTPCFWGCEDEDEIE